MTAVVSRVVTVLVACVVVLGAGLASAANAVVADEPAGITWSTEYTATETVTVTESATIDGVVGSGSASATAMATATGTATAATYWEVYYWASVDAQQKASAAAKAKAEAEARPVALAKARADAQAKADAAKPKTWSTTQTVTETVKVTESATVDGFVGTGSASATATATATGSATAATWWEVSYYATQDAYAKASAAAKVKAEAEARPVALAKARADAQAKADAAKPKTWSTTQTVTETVTVTETATIGDFEGEGTATATATASATETATAATWWEVYYWATVRAYNAARERASQQADTEARGLALDKARADAQRQSDAASSEPTPTPTPTPTDPADGDDGGGGTTPTDPAPTPTDPAPTPTAPSPSPTGPTCGAEVLKADGTPWSCTFADEFRGDQLDGSKWTAVETETSRFHYGDCFRPGDGVEVRGGALRLTTEYHEQPFVCPHPKEPFETNYTSGTVTTLGKFSQTYGRVAIRAAMAPSNGPGMGSALWLVPDEPTRYGSWPHSGEIDIVEYFSAFADRLIPTLHYDSLTSFTERTNNHCYVYQPTSFHTYVLEWTSTRILITVDGKTCLDHALNPAPPLTSSAPFDRPFNINLTQTLGSGKNVRPEGTEIESATMSVDYVRVWS